MSELDLVGAMNKAANTEGLEWAGACNAYAGTVGLEALGALNAANGSVGLGLNAVLNALAGTQGLEAQAAANVLATSEPEPPDPVGIVLGGSALYDHSGPDLPYPVDPEALAEGVPALFVVQYTANPTNTNTPPSFTDAPDVTPLIAPSAPPEGFIGSAVWVIPYAGGTETWTWQPEAGYEFADGLGGSLQVAWFFGVDLDDPLASTVGEKPFSGGNATTHTAPSVETTVPNAFIVGGFNTGSGSTAITIPAGWTSLEDSAVRDGQLAYKGVQEEAGETGTATWTRESGSQRGQAWQVALKPAG